MTLDNILCRQWLAAHSRIMTDEITMTESGEFNIEYMNRNKQRGENSGCVLLLKSTIEFIYFLYVKFGLHNVYSVPF